MYIKVFIDFFFFLSINERCLLLNKMIFSLCDTLVLFEEKHFVKEQTVG